MNNYLKTIGKSALVAGLVTASYVVGLNQNPTFSELPPKAREAIVETHQDLEKKLNQSADEYHRGNRAEAFNLYLQAYQEAGSLKKIDSRYEHIIIFLRVWSWYYPPIIGRASGDNNEMSYYLNLSDYENFVAIKRVYPPTPKEAKGSHYMGSSIRMNLPEKTMGR